MPEKILITPIAKYSQSHSDVSAGRFVFTYHIKIDNQSAHSIQLLSRYWKITDANGDVQQVQGEGVVGEQPLLMPAGTFQYESFCILPTPLGWMEGHYKMSYVDGQTFDVTIPRFVLEVPGVIQ